MEQQRIIEILLENKVIAFEDLEKSYNLIETKDGNITTVKNIIKSINEIIEEIKKEK